MKKTWVPGHEGKYQVTDTGDVISFVRNPAGRPLTKTVYDGYATVFLAGRRVRVHRLMLEAFVGPAPFDGAEGLHRDDVRSNNVLANLRWGTHADNMADRTRNGGNPNAKKIACKRGHPFDEQNTRITPTGSRECRTCAHTSKMASQRARRGTVAA